MLLVLEGTTRWVSVYPETFDYAILKSVQGKLIKQGHKKIITFFQPTQNSGCYSNQKGKLYGRYDYSRTEAYGTDFVNKGQLGDIAQVFVTPEECV